jgi:quercetin dioxygenase-like cupin family protein
MKLLLPLLLALLQFSGGAVAQQKVESVGITPAVKLEEVISGHLTELNGKFKLRVTELTFAPGASPACTIMPGREFAWCCPGS